MKSSLFSRKPTGTVDCITRATRLIEAETIAAEVDEALKLVKDGFATEMDRCIKRKNDSVRKNQALVQAMYDFSDFLSVCRNCILQAYSCSY